MYTNKSYKYIAQDAGTIVFIMDVLVPPLSVIPIA